MKKLLKFFKQKQSDNRNKRLIIVFCIAIFAFSLAIFSLYSTATNEAFLKAIDTGTGGRTVYVGTLRGNIFDHRGEPLTGEKYEYIAVIPPTESAIAWLRRFNPPAATLDTLEGGYPAKFRTPGIFNEPGVKTLRIPVRYSGVAAHIIGHLDSDGVGVSGIEQSFEQLLTSRRVTVRFDTDARGRTLAGSATKQNYRPPGNGVMLTIDRRIQKIAESAAIQHMDRGAVVVLENSSGKIRAMVSLPTFDPAGVSKALYEDNSPFFNRALAGYNSGSVFKVVTAAAALEERLNFNFNCTGYITLGARGENRVSCPVIHEGLRLAGAFAHSCNGFFVEAGLRLGADVLLNTARNFGFGTPVTLAENLVSAGGVLPDLAFLQATPAEVANLSFGQGRLMTTPLQIASMIQTVANGGRMIKPALIEGITDSDGNLVAREPAVSPTNVISEQTARYLKNIMIKTVREGTGTLAAPLSITTPGTGAGGKTGTAQTGIFGEDGRTINQAWFGGFFPAEDPRYTIVVMVEDGISGGQSAAPIFREIAQKIGG